MSAQGPLQWDVARQTALMAATEGVTEHNVDPQRRIAVESLANVARMHVAEMTGLATPASVPLDVVGRATWANLTLQAWKPYFDALAQAIGGTATSTADTTAENNAASEADESDPMPKAAKAAFDKAIILDPKDPRSRYFLAVSKDLDGDHTGAINDWLALLKDTPKDAPWETDLIRTIEQVGKINKIDVTKSLASAQEKRTGDLSATLKSIAAAPIPGPSKADMAKAAKLPPGQQQQMVTSMVEGLETKLAKNPKNVDGWIMLMRSRMTLGETAKAKAALTKSVASNPEAQSKLLREAQILGVPGT